MKIATLFYMLFSILVVLNVRIFLHNQDRRLHTYDIAEYLVAISRGFLRVYVRYCHILRDPI